MRPNHKIGMRSNLIFEKGTAMSAHAKKPTFFTLSTLRPKEIKIAISKSYSSV
jgi:hypothetical protein